MKTSPCFRSLLGATLLSTFAIASSVEAATIYAGANGDWDSDIWRPGQTGSIVTGLRPAAGDDANLSTTTSTRTISVSTAVPTGTSTVLNLIAKGTTATDVILNIQPKGHLQFSRFMNCTAGTSAKFTVNLGIGSRITCTGVPGEGGVLLASGANSVGEVNQTGGTFDISDQPPLGLQLTGGSSHTARGTYNISGGLLKSRNMIRLGSGTSTLNISDTAEVETGTGGIINTSGATASTINLSGGSLIINGPLTSAVSPQIDFNWTGGRFAAKKVENILYLQNTGTGGVFDICGEGTGTLVHTAQGTTTYEQGAASSIRIEISGTGAGQYDVYDATTGAGGGVIIAGSMEIYLLGNYVPAQNATFDVIKAHSINASGLSLRGAAADRFDYTIEDRGSHYALCLKAKVGPEFSTKPPFKILWNNDLTNIPNQAAPYNKFRGFNTQILEQSIDETGDAGIDVHLLATNVGWTPTWPSTVFSLAAHKLWGESFSPALPRGVPNRFERFILETNSAPNDIMATFVARCHDPAKNNPKAFVSYRLNDYHHLSIGLDENDSPAQNELNIANCQFYYEHPELRVGLGSEIDVTGHSDFVNSYLHDWSIPEARQYKLRLIKEVIANYDIDGIELDFMRHWVFFNKDVSNADRMAIMRNFVREVRAALDRKGGRHRYLSVRICGYITDAGTPTIKLLERSGVDLVGFANAGVEMFNLTHHYFTDLQLSVKAIRDALPPNVAVYAESHYTNAFRATLASGSPENVNHRRMNAIDQYTAAHVAYEKGADGISFFNMHYHRNDAKASPTNNYVAAYEPDFTMFQHLRDKDEMADQDQHYVIGLTQSGPKKKGRPLVGVPVLNTLKSASIYMYPPTNDWAAEGRVRIQGVGSLAGATFELYVNGTLVTTTTTDVSEATFGLKEYNVQNHGNDNEYKAWTFDTGLLNRDAANTFAVKLISGSSPQLFYLDVTIPTVPPAP